jgi:hypothetical protein
MQTFAVVGMAILATVAFLAAFYGFFAAIGRLADWVGRFLASHPRANKVASAGAKGTVIALGLFVAYRAVVVGIGVYGKYSRAADAKELRARQLQFRDRCLEERAIRSIRSVAESCDEAATRVVR